MRSFTVGALVGATLLMVAPRVDATYSIVATDSAAGQIGGIGASCVGRLNVSIIYGAEPATGAIHAQAAVNTDARDRGVALLRSGSSPADIITEITSGAFDPNAGSRQYGIVDLSGRHAGYTGNANGSVAADQQGTFSSFTYSVQGNILTGTDVLDRAENAFVGGGCDLADRLMLALEAGAENMEGDSRCTPDVPADSAFLRVQGTVTADLSVTDTGNASAVVLLRAQYDAWRADNPCPVAIDDDEMADTDGGITEPMTPSDSGCGCTGAGETTGGLLLLALALAFVRRRRAR